MEPAAPVSVPTTRECPLIPFDEFELLPSVEAEEPTPRTLLLRVRGAFDDATGAELGTVLDEELGESAFYRVVLDLSRVTLLIPAAAQRTLLQLRRRCRVQNIILILIGTAHPAVHQPMLNTGLLPLFDIRASLPSALHGHGSPARRSIATGRYSDKHQPTSRIDAQ